MHTPDFKKALREQLAVIQSEKKAPETAASKKPAAAEKAVKPTAKK